MKRKRTAGRILTAAASIGALLTSVYLVQIHVEVSVIGTAAGGLCDMGDAINCDAAAQSPFATLLGIPIAAIGLAFYAGATLLVLGPGRKASVTSPVAAPAILQTFYALSVLYSIFLAVISFTVLDSICPVCFVLYLFNVLAFVGAWMWSARGLFATLSEQIKCIRDFVSARHFHLLLGTGLVVLVGSMLYIGAQVQQAEERARLQERLQADEPAVDMSRLRSDMSPAKGAGPDAPVVIVEFSNYGCPWCARLNETIEAVLPEFSDEVRLEFRTLPGQGHAASMVAARAAHCAQEQRAFSDVHGLLFDNISGLTESRLREVVAAVDIDHDAFMECVSDQRSSDAVARDRNAASSIGVSGTPTFFVNGRQHSGFVEPSELRRLIRSALAESEESNSP